jgi:hypothetical protein
MSYKCKYNEQECNSKVVKYDTFNDAKEANTEKNLNRHKPQHCG